MSYNRGAPAGPRRGQPQRIASGARAAPYSRPEASRMASSGSWKEENADAAGSKQWPPNQLTIRGASGPTWIIVANLLRGTTEADINETFQQFGEIEDIKLRKAPSENHPSIAFEIAFTARSAASLAVEKLDGALADGRLLQVTYRDATKFNARSQPVAPPVQAVQAQPIPSNRELLPTVIPSGPRAQQLSHPKNGQDLLSPKVQPRQNVQAAQKNAPAPSLQSRLMSAQQLKALQRQQTKTSGALKVVPGVPTGPKGSKPVAATSASIPLAKRITLPLAMRLSEEAKRNGPASSKVPLGPSKNRKARSKAKAKNANGMEID